MKVLNLKEMEVVEGGGGNKYVLVACGAILATMEYSIVNPIWAAIHLSSGAGCLLYTAMSSVQ
jgi:hypothetical protein